MDDHFLLIPLCGWLSEPPWRIWPAPCHDRRHRKKTKPRKDLALQGLGSYLAFKRVIKSLVKNH